MRKNKGRFFIASLIVSLIFSSSALYAKDTAYERWPSALGFSFSSLAGNPGGGLHYQRWLDKLGFACTAGILYSPEAFYGSILDYSVTASVQYRVYGADFADWFSGQLYVWGQAGHIGYIRSATSPLILDAVLGVGIGIETILFDHFSFPLEFGYTGQFPIDTAVNLSFSGGIRYRY